MATCCTDPYRLDRDAIASLWHTLRHDLHAFLSRRLPSAEDADDVLQEVFLRIHETASQPGCADCTRAWTYAITRRTLADFYRRRERRPALQSDATLDELPADTVASSDVHEEVLSWLVPLIDELPEHYRIPLRMADVEGKTQQEVADHVGLSLSGAKSRVQRARRRLAGLLHACCEVVFGPGGQAVSYRRRQPEAACAHGCHEERV